MGQIWDRTAREPQHRLRPTAAQLITRRALRRLAVACVLLCTVMALAAVHPAALVAIAYWAVLPVATVWAAGYVAQFAVWAVRR